MLLAYGRTLSIIARDLQIAKGTARTHIENIYRKLDVHKQQELIDLVGNVRVGVRGARQEHRHASASAKASDQG